MKHLYNLFAVFFGLVAVINTLRVNEVYEHSPVLGVLLGASAPFFAVMSYAARRMAVTQSRPVLPEIKGARWISGRLYIDRNCNSVICCYCRTECDATNVKHLVCGYDVVYECPVCHAEATIDGQEVYK